MKHKNTNRAQKKYVTEVVFLVVLGTALSLMLSFSNPSILTIIAAGISLALIPLFLFYPRMALLVLLAARPLIDFVGERVSLHIQDALIINLNSVVSIFVFVWGILYLAIKRVRIHTLPLFAVLLLLSFFTALSTFFSHAPVESFGEWIRITNFLILFALAFSFTKTYRDLSSFVLAGFVSSLSPLCFAAYQFITRTGLSDEASANRLLGTFAHPALFGQFLAFLFLVTIAAILLTKRARFELFVFLGIIGTTLVLTYTRGAWIFAAIGTGLLAARFFRKEFWKIVAGFGILLVIIFGGILFLQTFTNINSKQINVVSRITESFSFNPQSSVAWRLRFWKSALTRMPKYIATGYGAGTFFQYAVQELNTQFDAHNDYLKLLVELGIAGIGLLMALFLDTFFHAIKYLRTKRDYQHQVIATTIIAILLGIAFESFFDNLYQNTTLYWLFFSLLGSAFSFLALPEKEKEESHDSPSITA